MFQLIFDAKIKGSKLLELNENQKMTKSLNKEGFEQKLGLMFLPLFMYMENRVWEGQVIQCTHAFDTRPAPPPPKSGCAEKKTLHTKI